MGPIDLHLGPLVVLALVGLVATVGGFGFFIVWLILHVSFV